MWHTKNTYEIERILNTNNQKGLTNQEVQKRQESKEKTVQVNRIKTTKKTGFYHFLKCVRIVSKVQNFFMDIGR